MYNNHNNTTLKRAPAINRSASCNNNSFQRSPKFAIVRLSEGTDVLRLYQLLLENGYPEVSFVNEVRENAFLPYSMQNQTQLHEQLQNDDQQQNKLLKSDERMNGGTAQMAIERKTSSEAVHREQRQQCQPSLNLQHQQHPNTTSASSRVRPASVIGKSPVGRTFYSSVPSSNSQNSLHRFTRSTNNPSEEVGAFRPALFEASSSSSSSSTDATSGIGGGGSAVSVPLIPPMTTVSTGKKNDEYAVCLLCNNRIMSSRLSNLTNHVRRHASLKQYRCCHCQYSHNEMAKVRLHMSHNHQDFSSQPMDMLSFEMQIQWGLLMEQCFPEHSKRFGPSAANSQFRNLEELQKYVDMERPYTCIECGEVLTGYQLVNHLEDVHRQECVPFACGQCGYQSSFQWKIRLHISVKHPEKAAETTVATLPAGSNFMLFLQKYFAEVHIPVEEDEAKLVAELQESNRMLATMNALADEGDGMDNCVNDEECNDDEKKRKDDDNKKEIGSQSSLNLNGEEEFEVMENEANEEEEGKGEHCAKKGVEHGTPRRTSESIEDDIEENVRVSNKNEKSNNGKKTTSIRKREKSCEDGEAEEHLTEKRHTLRHSNRLLMVAEKRNNSLSSNIGATTPVPVGARKK